MQNIFGSVMKRMIPMDYQMIIAEWEYGNRDITIYFTKFIHPSHVQKYILRYMLVPNSHTW